MSGVWRGVDVVRRTIGHAPSGGRGDTHSTVAVWEVGLLRGNADEVVGCQSSKSAAVLCEAMACLAQGTARVPWCLAKYPIRSGRRLRRLHPERLARAARIGRLP